MNILLFKRVDYSKHDDKSWPTVTVGHRVCYLTTRWLVWLLLFFHDHLHNIIRTNHWLRDISTNCVHLIHTTDLSLTIQVSWSDTSNKTNRQEGHGTMTIWKQRWSVSRPNEIKKDRKLILTTHALRTNISWSDDQPASEY